MLFISVFFLVAIFLKIKYCNMKKSEHMFNLNLVLVLGSFPCGSAGKESACSVEDLCSIPELGRSPGEGKGYPLQYPGLENPMDCRGHGVAKSQTGQQFSLSLIQHISNSENRISPLLIFLWKIITKLIKQKFVG